MNPDKKTDQRWWDLKLTGFLSPREENRYIFYGMISLLIMTVLYIASFYLNR